MDPFAKPAEVARPKFFQSSNGDLVEVTDSLIEACYTVKCLISGRGRMLFKNSLGGVFIYENNQVIHQKEQKIMATLLQNDAERLIVYIHEVRTPILRRLLDFIAYHQQDITERERKAWNATFIEQCSQILCELASVRNYLMFSSHHSFVHPIQVQTSGLAALQSQVQQTPSGNSDQ
jgi:hypothetical protein